MNARESEMSAPAFAFRFAAGEDEHSACATAEFRDLLTLLAKLLLVSNDGFAHFGTLSTFDKRDKRTLQAALLVRSLKAVSCAVNLAFRGYYTPSITLSRSVFENHLIIWDLEHNAERVAEFYDDRWPISRKFEGILKDMDAANVKELEARGDEPPSWSYRERMGSKGLYGEMSEVAAHPRPKAVRLEFDASALRLMSGPEFVRDTCRMALAHALAAAVANLECFVEFAPHDDDSGGWRRGAEAVLSDLGPTLERETTRL